MEDQANQLYGEFKPDLTPAEMLKLGVFGGHYFNGRPEEFPASWFEGVKLTTAKPDAKLNFFEVLAGQSHDEWQKKGWISEVDPLGWFQWYCRYYQGRRLADEDIRQIKRWKAIRRHKAQINKHCQTGDLTCRRRQRQALLQWAYDSRKY